MTMHVWKATGHKSGSATELKYCLRILFVVFSGSCLLDEILDTDNCFVVKHRPWTKHIRAKPQLILTLPHVPPILETDSHKADTCLAAAVPSISASISFLSRVPLSCCWKSLSCLQGQNSNYGQKQLLGDLANSSHCFLDLQFHI